MKQKFVAALLAGTVALAAFAATASTANAGGHKYWDVSVKVGKKAGPKYAANYFCDLKGYSHAASYDFNGWDWKNYGKVGYYDFISCSSGYSSSSYRVKPGITFSFSLGKVW